MFSMRTEARARIDAHPLMRKEEVSYHEVRINSSRSDLDARKKENAKKWKTVTLVHLGVFVFSFVFTAGVLVLAILLWVRPDELLPLVLAGAFSALVFVVLFAGLRFFVLEHVVTHLDDTRDYSGATKAHDIAKSVSYGIVALVLAFVIAMLLIKIASANIL